jgi:hypothetical protein
MVVMKLVLLTPMVLFFREKCNIDVRLTNILAQVKLDLNGVRKLIKQQLLLLTPGDKV